MNKVIAYLWRTEFGSFLNQTFVLPGLIMPIIMLIYSDVDNYFAIYIVSVAIGKPLDVITAFLFDKFYQDNRSGSGMFLDILASILLFVGAYLILTDPPFIQEKIGDSNITINSEAIEMSF